MRWKKSGFFLRNDASELEQETARASLGLRARQSLDAQWAVWAFGAVAAAFLWPEVSLPVLLAWYLPLASMAYLNARVSHRVLRGLDKACAKGLSARQRMLWWTTVLNQTVASTTVWWLGQATVAEGAAVGTFLQLVYLAGATINASTHPPTFMVGACINLLSLAVFWMQRSEHGLVLGVAILAAGALLLKLSRQMAQQLKHTVAIGLENQALVQQLAAEKRVAEAATRFKSEFLAGITHEVRTPLGAIMGMSHLALKTELTPRQREYLGIIQQCSDHLHTLVNRVLDWSKVEAQQLELEHARFDLLQMVENTCAMVRDKATAKGLQLNLEFPPEEPHAPPPRWVVGDALRLSEVLLNVLGNAIKFTHEGHITVRVACTSAHGEADAPTVTWRFEVHDTGVGMTEAQMARLFQDYAQGDASTARRYGGTGLGLALSQRLCALMSGQMGVNSQQGKGSVFWFNVDLAVDAEANPAHMGTPPAPTQAQATTPPPSVTLEGEPLAVLATVAKAVLACNPATLELWRAQAKPGSALHTALGAAWHRLDTAIAHCRWPDAVAQLEQLASCGAPLPGVALQWPPLAPGPRGALDRPQVWVVDDTPANLHLMTELLSPEFDVRVLHQGEWAVTLFTQCGWVPDLILLDHRMEGLSGLDILQQLKAHPVTRSIPVLMVSASTQWEDDEKALAAGAADWVSKPISPARLLTRVRTHLKRF